MYEVKIDQLVLTRELKRLDRAWSDYQRKMKLGAREIVKKQGRLFATDLAHVTIPSGTGPQAHKQIRLSVIRDVGYIYRPLSDAFRWVWNKGPQAEGAARLLWQAGRLGRRDIVAGLLNSFGAPRGVMPKPWDHGVLHESSRERRGRVRRRGQGHVVIEEKERAEYIKKKAGMAGWAKAGWAAVARDLGGTRPLKGWITRHKKAPGEAVWDLSRGGVGLWLVNHVSYIASLMTHHGVRAAMNHRARSMERELKGMAERKTNAKAPLKAA